MRFVLTLLCICPVANLLKLASETCNREDIQKIARRQLDKRYEDLFKRSVSVPDVMEYFGEAQQFYSDYFNSGPVCFDNLGFVGADKQPPQFTVVGDSELAAECPSKSFDVLGQNMYRHMVTDGLGDDFLRGKSILEVGSGRGKGGAYIAQAFNPRQYVGMDLNTDRVNTARKAWGKTKNLEFMQGNALQIPLQDDNVDVVLNVESSFHYPNFDKFLSEVFRVLKPGGVFLWTSLLVHQGDTMEKKKMAFQKAGFEFLKSSDITNNVTLARRQGLENCSDEVLQALCTALSHVPEYWDFVSLPGGIFFESLKYIRFVVKKP